MTRLVMIAAFLVACSKGKPDPGPPCDKVVDHMLDLMKQAMPGHDIDSMAPRDSLLKQCEKRNLPASARKCMVDAKTFNELAPCQPKAAKPAQHEGPTPPAPAPNPTAPAPTPPAPGTPNPSTNPTPAPAAAPTGSGAPAPSAPAPAPAGSGSAH